MNVDAISCPTVWKWGFHMTPVSWLHLNWVSSQSSHSHHIIYENDTASSTNHVRRSWERENWMKIQNLDDAKCLWESQCSSSKSLILRDFCNIFLFWLFKNPQQKSNKLAGTQCWCCKECVSARPHILQVHPFWEGVGCSVSRILGFAIDVSFFSLYPRVIPEGLCKRKSTCYCWEQ